jgi:uncharacterized membrane protein YgdD (TMEM256/DUF423 family)
MNKTITATGIGMIMLAIILGAFGAHALKEVLTPERLTSFETGVKYQMYHGLAFLIVGLLTDRFNFSVKSFFTVAIIGIVLFSGSIYLLAMQDVLGIKMSFLGPITPLGGVLLITSWGMLLVKTVRKG